MTTFTDRPRQRIPRDEAVRLVHQLYDALDAADAANDPQVRQAREDQVHQLGRRLIAGTLSDIQARRNAAAAASRTMIEPQAWHDATIDAGHSAIDPATLNSPVGAMQASNILCRTLLDYPELFPPGVPHHTALALHLRLLGQDTWLTRRPRGGSGNGWAWMRALVHLTSVYYHSGYHGLGLELAAKALFQDDPDRWPTLEKFRTRNRDLMAVCDFAREEGIADATVGRPYGGSPLAKDYTLNQLEVLGQAPRHGKRAAKKQAG